MLVQACFKYSEVAVIDPTSYPNSKFKKSVILVELFDCPLSAFQSNNTGP